MPRRSRPFYDASRNQWILRHKGKKSYLCSGRGEYVKALRLASEIMGQNAPVERPETVTQACDAWLRSDGGDWEEHILSPFMEWTAGVSLNAVHADTLNDYLKHLKREKYAASTVRRQVRYARKVLNWAVARKYMTVPVPPLPKLPKIAKVRRDIAAADTQAIFDRLPKRAKDILEWMRWTGARPGEACGLKHEEIEGRVCTLYRGKTYDRTGEPRVIVMTAKALEVIARQETKKGYVFLSRLGTPYTAAGLRSIVKRAAKDAGIELPGSYRLRHTFGQWMVDSGASIDEVGAALGHEPGSRETQIYAQVRRDRVVKAIETLDEKAVAEAEASKESAKAAAVQPERKAKGKRRAAG